MQRLCKIQLFLLQRLKPEQTVEEEIAEAVQDPIISRIRGICGLMLFEGDDAKKKVSVLSGGEKSRVMLGKIIAKPANLLFLDEPTHHLDLYSVESLLEAVEDFAGGVVLVTHSEAVLKRYANKVILFQNNGVRYYDGSYSEFLERWGWNNDSTSQKSSETTTKNSRQERALRVQERSKVLGPLRKECARLESAISLKEELKAKLEAELASSAANVDVVELSSKYQTIEQELMELMNRWEAVQMELEEKALQWPDLADA